MSMAASHRKRRSLRLPKAGLFERRSARDWHLRRYQGGSIMFYAISWFVVLGLLALWSLGAWAFHAVAVWAVSNAGALTGATKGVESLRLPDWLAPWVPTEIVQAMTSLLSGLAPAIESLLQTAPSLAGGLSVATWVIWGLGSVLLVLLGAGLHLLIAMWRRRGGGSGPQPRPPV
ncbi:MAG: hypothetical protein Q8R98_17715, partial [Rubrivivax sp.]|nr:hypothetical protein [Rubrivivax sp.]